VYIKLIFFRFVIVLGLFLIILDTGSTVIFSQQPTGVDILKKRIARIGKLPFTRVVPVRYLDNEVLKGEVEKRFEAEYPRDLALKESVFIRLMGFTDRTLDVRRIRKRILLDNVGGYYDRVSKALLTLREFRNVDYVNSMILLHELRHSVQDIYFDIAFLLEQRPYSDFDDRKLALLAAIEGDATFLMVQCSDLDPRLLASTQTADALISFAPVAKASMLYREPLVIKKQLVMPFIQGLRFFNSIYKKKKWNGVNRVLRRPPLSSEQILHPKKYLKNEKPHPVSVRYAPRGYRLYHSGVVGEYYLNVLLKQEGQHEDIDYARGWGGDMYHIYKHPKKPLYFLVWKSSWDKDIFCSHFYTDFRRFLEWRFKAGFKKGKVAENAFIAGRGGKDKEEYFFLMKIGKQLVYARSNDRKQMNTFIYGGNYD
jgi:hypothetical protein